MEVMATVALRTVSTKSTGLGIEATNERKDWFEDATLLAALLLLQLLLRQALWRLTIAHRFGHLLQQAHVPREASVVDVEHQALAVEAQRLEQQQQDDNHKYVVVVVCPLPFFFLFFFGGAEDCCFLGVSDFGGALPVGFVVLLVYANFTLLSKRELEIFTVFFSRYTHFFRLAAPPHLQKAAPLIWLKLQLPPTTASACVQVTLASGTFFPTHFYDSNLNRPTKAYPYFPRPASNHQLDFVRVCVSAYHYHMARSTPLYAPQTVHGDPNRHRHPLDS